MKKLFTVTKRKDAQGSLITIAKIVKIFYIVLAIVWVLITFIQMIVIMNDDVDVDGTIILQVVFVILGFFVILFIGWLNEVLLLGFSTIVHNQHEELVLKNKVNETDESYNDNDLYTRLHKLHSLKELGIITEEEYELKKKNALAGL